MAGLALAGCGGSTKTRDCLPRAEYDQLKAELQTLEGESEYAILGRYGKPKNISMNTRSEKEYLYHACGDSASKETLVLRFGSTGRVREGYVDRK